MGEVQNPMIDRKLMQEFGKKAKQESIGEQDFDAAYQLFEQICNTDEILKFKLRNYSESFQFHFDEYSYGIIFDNGSCRTEKGSISLPDVTFWIHKNVALDILNGRVYSAVAHMNGDVDYIGYKDGAIRFIPILEEVLDIIQSAADRGEAL